MGSVLALDVGYRATGWLLLEGGCPVQCGVIRTVAQPGKRAIRRADDDAERCAQLARELRALLDGAGPLAVVAELPTAGALSARAIRAMALATGVVVAVLELVAVPVEWTTPEAGRLATTGRRSATKEAVRAGACRALSSLEHMLPRTALWEHVTDAAAAYLAARTGALVRMVERGGCT